MSDTDENVLRCSFCGKSQNEVKKLGVSGYPMKVYPTTKPSGKTGGF